MPKGPCFTQHIYKYPLAVVEDQNILMPAGAKVLHVAEQHGVLTLWARVNTDNPDEFHTILIRGTGDVYPTYAHHLGTVLLNDGYLVLHIFLKSKEG